MEEFSKLVKLMEDLRGDEGCSWDKKQTSSAFKSFLLEEVYELIDAIERDDVIALKEELGDLLFHIIFVAQIYKEKKSFDIKDVINNTYIKMYNRHPHVFKNSAIDKPIEQNWEDLKKNEKKNYSLLENIPLSVPALLRAYIIGKRVARVGFDWEKLEDIYEKLSEEIGELREAEVSGNQELVREEIGDLLFTVSNISRFHNIDPEDALRFTTEKFIKRFNYIEKNIDISNTTIAAMDKLWNKVKGMEERGQ